jgi:hypothetical protein
MLLQVGLEDWVLAQSPTFGKALVVCQYMDANARKVRNAMPPTPTILSGCMLTLLSSPQFPHEVAKRGKRKEEIYYTTS